MSGRRAFPLALLALPAAVLAADRTVPVRLAANASPQEFAGTIRGYNGIAYTFAARAGQVMSVTFITANKSAYINVLAPGADQALFNGSLSGDRFSGKLPISGVYKVQVYLMRNAARRNEHARYRLTLALSR